MASTYSALKIELIGTGEQTGTWGTTTNTNLGTAIEEAITGSVDVTFASGTVTLTLTDTNASQAARNLRLNLTGTSGGAQNLIVPAIEKQYIVYNGCADTITIKNSTGTGVAVPAGKSMIVFNDGVNVKEANTYFSSVATGAITCTSLTDSGLTSGRVTYATTGGLLTDSSSFTFDGTTLTVPSASHSGNLAFTGTGNRITGDFGNATQTNRVLFQSSTTNGATSVGAIPNGTSIQTNFSAYSSSSDPTNASVARFGMNGTQDTRLESTITGTGTYLPLTMYTGGSERLRIDTSGNVGIGTSSPNAKIEVSGTSIDAQLRLTASGVANTVVGFNNSGSTNFVGAANNTSYLGNGQAYPLVFTTSSTERMRIDTSGNVGIGTSSPSQKFVVSDSGAAGFEIIPTGVDSGPYFQGYNRSTSAYIPITTLSSYIAFRTGSSPSERMRITSTGQVGIGVTPSGWTLGSALQLSYSAYITGQTTTEAMYMGSNAYWASGWKYINNGTATQYESGNGTHLWYTAASGTAGNAITFTERMRIDSSGRVGIGTSGPSYALQVAPSGSGSDQLAVFNESTTWTSNGGVVIANYYAQTTLIGGIKISSATATSGFLTFHTGGTTERMRITTDGALCVGKTSAAFATAGFAVNSSGATDITVDNDVVFRVNRLTSDGILVRFAQDSVSEGDISVSGTTVSYNGGHLARWSQLPNNQKDDTLLKGTVMSNLDDMCVWVKDGETLPNEQLNKMKVSNVEGDTNVAGVFVNWTFDEQCQSDDMNVAMTGDMIIRIAEGVVVQKGDLLMSAGDGTAKPQGDDIRRSKTVAKVTSNHVTCTYADGSYCVPCVLMAC